METEFSKGGILANFKQRILENVASFQAPTEFTCEACGGDGCLVCHPTDIAKCSICLPEYYMKADYKCHTDKKTTEGPTTTVSALIWGQVTGIWLMALAVILGF